MAKYCPIVDKRVVYLTCMECKDKVCFKQPSQQKSNDAKESVERKEDHHGKSESV